MSMLSGMRAFVILVLFANPAVAKDDPLDIVFINPASPVGFWGDVSDVMQVAAEQLSMDLEVLHAHRDRLAMVRLAKSVAAREQQPDAVILVNELEQGGAMLHPLAAQGIATYFLLNTLSEVQRTDIEDDLGAEIVFLGSIVPDNDAAGYAMLQDLVAAVRDGANDTTQVNVLAILGDRVTQAAILREEGLRRAVRDSGNAEIVRAIPVLWDPNIAHDRVRTALDFVDVDVIWAANDDLALAALQAIRKCGTPCAQIKVTGLNWSEQGLQAVASGDLVSSHGGHLLAGGIALASLRNVMTNSGGALDLTLDMAPIAASNVHTTSDILFDRSWSNIDFVALAQTLAAGTQRIDPLDVLEQQRIAAAPKQVTYRR